MIKKIGIIIMFSYIIGMPVFAGAHLYFPSDRSEDLSINTEGNKNQRTARILGHEFSIGQNQSTIAGSEETIYGTINKINEYLRRSFAVIAMVLFIYGGYSAITSGGDSKQWKKLLRTLIGIAVGLAIAMLSSALVKIIVNLI